MEVAAKVLLLQKCLISTIKVTIISTTAATTNLRLRNRYCFYKCSVYSYSQSIADMCVDSVGTLYGKGCSFKKV